MERSEPALVPEWLKTSSGSVTGSTGSSNQFAPSLLHSDDHAVSKQVRNRPSSSINGHDIGRPGFSDRTTSSYFRRNSSSNGSSHLRSYSSFGKKDITDYRDKDKSVFSDYRPRDFADPLGIILPSRSEKEVLRRSQSTLAGRRGDSWPQKVAGDSKNGNRSNHSDDSFLAGVSVSNVNKYAFERDFPSLGTEERHAVSEIGRVPSPGLSTAIRSLPVGSSAVIGSDGWTSALVEVPGTIGINSMNVTSSQQTVSTSAHSTPPSLATALNMAEAVAQRPSRSRTPPLLSVETQRLEELVMKQSRQLIPMTPSMSKTSVLSPSDKGKPKTGQLHVSNPASTLRGGPTKSDMPKTSVGKLHILKPSRELNAVSSAAKDSLSPTNGSKVANSPLGIPLSTAGLSNNPNFTTLEQKPSPKTVEKKSSAQAQSRNDFFNLIKKKSSANSPSVAPCSCPAESPSALEKPDEATAKPHSLLGGDAPPPADTSMLDLSTKSIGETTHNGEGNREMNSSPDAILYPDEEEAAFLRSLGWEENAEEDEGLTEEEINAFYEEYLKLRPALKLQGVTSKILVPLINSQNGNCCSASSESSSSYSRV